MERLSYTSARRAVIISTLATLGLIGLALTGPASADWVARHGMNSNQYQSAFNQLTSQGHGPVAVDACRVPNARLYAAIWSTEQNRPWIARHGLSAAQYQQAFNAFVGQGYRLADVTVADGNFAALWIRDGVAFQARHGLTGAQYQSAFNQFTSQGYRLVDVSGYRDANGTRFAALWVRQSGPAWVARHNLTAQQYQAVFNQYTGQGYRPVHVDGYMTSDGVRFAAIWERRGGPWVARHGLTGAQYQSAFDQFVGQGYRLTHVSCYNDGQGPRYAAIWSR
jgi:hypothetical protein